MSENATTKSRETRAEGSGPAISFPGGPHTGDGSAANGAGHGGCSRPSGIRSCLPWRVRPGSVAEVAERVSTA